MKISDIEVTPIHPERWGSDLDVVNAARVSFGKESTLDTSDGVNFFLRFEDAKLIRYLAKHKHHSPFNHTFLSFRIKAPIFVARQLVKHKFMPWNEVSRRYVDSEPEFYFPGKGKWREKAENVKQGSGREGAVLKLNNEDLWGDFDNRCDPEIHTSLLCYDALGLYNQLKESGVCPEQARMVLPLNTMTEWRWSGTLGAFLDMLVLRLDSHTQKETRDVALLIAEYVKKVFPFSYAAYLED